MALLIMPTVKQLLARLCLIIMLGLLSPAQVFALDASRDPDIVQLKLILEKSLHIMNSPTPPSPEGMLERSRLVLGLSEQAEEIMSTTHRHSDFGMSLRRTLSKYSVELMFVVADLFRDTQEITKAKDIYTEIINIYSGSAWSSYRNRATMELDILRNGPRQEGPSTDRFSIHLPSGLDTGPNLRQRGVRSLNCTSRYCASAAAIMFLSSSRFGFPVAV
jgi:hypothetical protein